MSLQSVRKELEALKKEVASGYRSIKELLNCNLHSLSDYELYRLIRYESPNLNDKPELTEYEFKNLSDSEILDIIGAEDL